MRIHSKIEIVKTNILFRMKTEDSYLNYNMFYKFSLKQFFLVDE